MTEERKDTRALAIASMVFEPSIIEKTQTESDNLFKTDNFSTAPISSVNSGNESIIDSKNLTKKIKLLMKAIKSKKTSSEGKIKIAEFMCNKLCDIYSFSPDRREIIIKELENIILNEETMSPPLRLYYLRFRDESVSYPVSVNLFRNGVRDKMRTILYFQILKYILRTNTELYNSEHCAEVMDEFESFFSSDNVSIYIKMEIADVFLLNNRVKRGYEMLDIIRQLEFDLLYNQEDYKHDSSSKRVKTIYDDSQNVHSSNVNESVLKSCVHLMEIESPSGIDIEHVRIKLKEIDPTNADIIDTVIERIEIDTARFKCDKNTFGLYDLFSSLWSYITKHPSELELYSRLIEEMIAMSKYCTTGHLSRFINVIQGYTDDEKLCFRITDSEQIKSVISYYLDTLLKDAEESIAESIIDDNKEPFYDFICSCMNTRIPELLKEYGKIENEILDAIKLYSNWEYWNINNDGTLVREQRTL